jgi:hypothetical protein
MTMTRTSALLDKIRVPRKKKKGEKRKDKKSVGEPADTIFALPNGWRHHPSWTTTETIDHRDRSPSPTTT